MRVSGERQRNRRKASPENLASARKAGSPASSSTSTVQGEKRTSSTREAQQRDRVLHQPEGAHDQAQRAARGLAARARELVVELGVLEVLQLERERLLEDHDVDALAELRAQQRLAERQAALCAGQRGHQHALEQHQPQHARGVVPARALRAATTASTMRAPIEGEPAGSRPAASVSTASAASSARLVSQTSSIARRL